MDLTAPLTALNSKALEKLSKQELIEINNILDAKSEYEKYHFKDSLFPDTGKFARRNYPKQMDCMRAGKTHKLRMFMAGNQSGKTLWGNYEVACHATGDYPEWWDGLRFDHPVNILCVGVSAEETKNVLQQGLLGDRADPGSGMIPKDQIASKPVSKSGVAEGVEVIRTKHITGGISQIFFKDNSQERDTFQGTKFDFAHIDEEPRLGVFTEVLTRTATTNGSILITFTPLKGISEVVLKFTDQGQIIEGEHPDDKNKYITNLSWDQVPHITEEMKEYLLAQYPAHERDARSKGIPALGSGAIYPIPESEIVVEPFEIPKDWPKAFGMDVGYSRNSRTAIVWGALDPNSDVLYIYSEHYSNNIDREVHAAAIRARGKWIRGCIDPASDSVGTGSQHSSDTTYNAYLELGLDLVKAKNAVDAGIIAVNHLFESSRLKIFSICPNLLKEKRTYHINEKGKIAKTPDHAVDALRYLVVTGFHDRLFYSYYQHKELYNDEDYYDPISMGASEVTGY